jgi:3-hydroxypropanoate dehydrogenase
MSRIDQKSLDIIFNQARSHTKWLSKDVPDQLLEEAYNLAKMGPTSVNSLPMRVVFVKSAAAKARLKPCLMEGNVEKSMSAPVTAIIGHDSEFYNQLLRLSPHHDVTPMFKNDPILAEETAFRNSTLQGAYFIIAARSLGLDCGPMSGFHPQKIDDEFFANSTIKVNFLCNLGYGDITGLHPRGPRLDFSEVCKLI